MGMTKTTKRPAQRDLKIGARVRHARIVKGIRMRELADAIGCAESSISKIESGHVVPSLPMLQRIVEALGGDMSSFFATNPDAPGIVQRAGQRMVANGDPIRDGKGISYERMVSFARGNLLEANIHIVEPGGGREDRVTHEGETLGYVLEGQIELIIEKQAYLLSAGDSFSYRNHLTSRYSNPGATVARMIWVNTPHVY
jgi:transcriptional regulator with XRE-family HTH domain